MQRILEIYDIEVLSNCFTYTGYVPIEDKYYQYVIWRNKNDYLALIQHLMRGIYHVGFNNEAYDYPVLHHLLNHFKEYRYEDGWNLAPLIYKKSQEIIRMEYSTVADYNKHIPQLDLYKVWHFNNPARACSLKQLEIAMRMELVEDMPYNHDYHVSKESELNEILDYNKHDVYATYLFFNITKGNTDNKLYKGKDKLQLRKDIQKMYNLPCLNMADVKIGEELLLKLYCDETGEDPKKLRKSGGSPRKQINIGECIFPYIQFKTKKFQALKDWFASQIITGTNGSFSDLTLDKVESLLPYVDSSTISSNREGEKRLDNINIKIQDSYIVYGTGGAHQSLCGKFVADDEWTILDIDVGSLYPSIEVQNNLYPEHLGPIFSHIFDKNIVSVRMAEKKKPKKERNPVIMEGFKLAANGSYGIK